jgi:hypothetical protein
VATGNAPALTGHEILALSFAVGLSSRRATPFEQLDWKPSTKVISRLTAPKFDFCSNPESGLDSDIRPCRFRADFVAKVFLGCRTKILRATGAFCARRCEGAYRLIQNRLRTSVVALKSDAAAERSKD